MDDQAVGNQPATSAMTCTEPLALVSDTAPPAPTLAMTRLGIVWPATKFRFDAKGSGVAAGETVRNDADVGAVAVTFNTTAPTPTNGTPPRPVTVKVRVSPGPMAPPPAA